MEYINKQGVLDEIHRLSESTIVCYIDPDDIEALDTIDIVRCGECRRRGKKECPLLMINRHNIDVPEDDDFCSWGEL